jgi:hypothetical protein
LSSSCLRPSGRIYPTGNLETTFLINVAEPDLISGSYDSFEKRRPHSIKKISL